MNLHRIGAFAAMVLAATSALGDVFFVADGREDAAARAQTLLEQVAGEHGIPGMAGAVFVGDAIAWSGGVGFADLELQAPVTRDSLFRLGSVSKLLTATLAVKLAEEGALDLDADIRTYVPEFPDKGSVITSRQLLGHLGGIRHYSGKDFDPTAPGGMIDLRFYPDTDSMLALFADDPLVAEAGTTYSYSTFGYTLLSVVMARAAEQSFLDLMQSRLLDPLGLSGIHADAMRAVIPGRVSAYDPPQPLLRERAGTGPYRALPVNPAYKWAGGGMLSTADDLARFGSVIVAPGYLTAESLEAMLTRQRTSGGEELEVGLGWRVGADPAGRRIAHHSGSMAGCRATLVVWPERRVSVSLLSNLSGTPDDLLQHAIAVGEIFLTDQKPISD